MRQHPSEAMLCGRAHAPSLRAALLGMVLSVCCAGTPAVGDPQGQKPERVVLRLKWFHQFQFAGYYAAKEKGYYAEEGLDVDIRERDPAKEVVGEVVSGGADYGVGDSGIVADYANGEPIAALAAVFQHNPLIFISKQSSGIISPYEMAGKRIMLAPSKSSEASLQAMLDEAGLSPGQYTTVKHSFNLDDLIDGKVDAVSAYLTNEPFYLASKGVKFNLINPQNYGLDFYGEILFTSRRELDEHPGRAEHFRRASLKGWQYALDHPDELAVLIKARYHAKPSLENLRFEAHETRKLILPDRIPLGQIESRRLQRTAAIYHRLGLARPLNEGQLQRFIHGMPPRLELTDAERDWLRQHPVIRVGIDRDFAPYEWINPAGEYVGLVADFMRLIEQRLGVEFTIAKDKDWHETLDLAKRGELDMIGAAVRTADREQYLSFTRPYIANPAIIINDTRHGYVGGLERLDGQRVAIERGYFVQELLARDYPGIRLVPAGSVREALLRVLSGQADAYVGDAFSASHAIKEGGMLNLGFSGQTPYQSESRIAVSKRDPELLSIIEKALASIPQNERDAIINHWMGLKIEQGIKPEILLKYGAAIAVLLLLFAYWIYRLRKSEEALRQSETRLSLAQSAAHIGIWDWDMLRGQSTFSPEYYALLGLPDGTPHRYEDFLAMVHPEDRARVAAQVEQSSTQPPYAYYVEYRVTRATDGTVRWLASKGRFINEAGRPLRAMGVVYDITERRQTEEKLRLTARIFDTTAESIIITDANRKIIDVNTAFTLITGYSRDEAVGRNPRFLKSGRHGPGFYEAMWRSIMSKGHWSGEIWNRRKNGDIMAEWTTLSALTDENGEVTHYVGIASDISLLKQHEKQLEHIAHYDALTGIPNRVLLADRMRQAIAHALRHQNMLGVCYLDLDGFKPINDAHGHEVGDNVLIEIARRITDALRSGDTVARLGGDEFVILLLELKDAGECEATVERLLEAIAEPLVVSGTAFMVTASIGITLFPQDDEDPDTLLRHADQAMYIAKQSGKNRHHLYDAEQDRRARTFSEAQTQIRQGLKNHEFELYYQPKIHMGSGQPVGAEALIRWRHPTRGLLIPAEFLPCLENSELENAISEWVIDHALGQLEQWRKAGQMLEVSVNVAANHLQSAPFLQMLRNKLAHYPALPRGALQIEILETAALADIPKVTRIIEACAEMGVGFALDDFGTGYSSLAYLRRLPAETLKIDQSFVRDMLTDEGDRAIIQGIIALARAFGRKTVAEGVETAEHCQALLAMGCDIGQGFGIARPMPAEDFARWCQSQPRQ